MNMELRNRASSNFEKYLNMILQTGEVRGLPEARLKPEEWLELNQDLKSVGVVLEPRKHTDGKMYYCFSKINTPQYNTANITNLRNRASSNFERYLNMFLQTGEKKGLPAGRLRPEEWNELNQNLKSVGVILVPRIHPDGYIYYWFSKSQNQPMNSDEKKQSFTEAKQSVMDSLVSQIKSKYNNIPDFVIRKMIESNADEEAIYNYLRFKQDGEYNDVSKQEFENAFIYAFQSSGNKDLLTQIAFHHHWNPAEHRIDSLPNVSERGSDWPRDRYIEMSGTQNWTWFRSCKGAVFNPVQDRNNPDGYHMALNVRITKRLLQILDDILIADGGRYIHSYKIPKDFIDVRSRHDVVTIYTNARNPELEQRIVKAIQPFVRSNDGLIGDMLGNGVCISPETSSKGYSVGTKISRDIADFIKQNKNRL